MSNAPILIGNHEVVIGPSGTRWWAENGFIRYETPTGDYNILTVKSCLARLQAVNPMVEERRKGGIHHYDEVEAWQKFVVKMVDLCKKAREQGEPTDASARRDRKRRLPTNVVVPDAKGIF